jgi:hypothetical protein
VVYFAFLIYLRKLSFQEVFENEFTSGDGKPGI